MCFFESSAKFVSLVAFLLATAASSSLFAQTDGGDLRGAEMNVGGKETAIGGDSSAGPESIHKIVREPDLPDWYAGKSVIQLQIDCDLERCSNPVFRQKLISATGLNVGMRFSEEAVLWAERRLAKTGFFKSVRVDAGLTESGVEIVLHANAAILIRNIRFEGLDTPPFRSELRKFVTYRRGGMYRGDPEKRKAQIESLTTFFEEDGYFGTSIDMEARPVRGKTHLIDIVFKIDKGKRLRICNIGIRGLQSMSYIEARHAVLAGAPFAVRQLEIMPPRFTSKLYEQGKDALIQKYRDRGYYQARIVEEDVRRDMESGCVRILLDIQEGPRWSVSFEGNEEFGPRSLKNELPFAATGYVDAEAIRQAAKAIEGLYEAHGYPFAEVSGRQFQDSDLDRRLKFEIDEGPLLRLDRIVFHGNESISGNRLRDVMQTKTFELFSPGGYLQFGRLAADLEAIETEYRKQGHLYAVVDRFATVTRPKKESLTLHIYIDEGQKTRVARVRIAGNKSVPNGVIENRLKMRSPEPFVPVEARADRSRIIQLYSTRGYPMAEVETVCRTLAGDKIPCRAPKIPQDCVLRQADQLRSRCETEQGGKMQICRRRRRSSRCEISEERRFERVRMEHKIDEGPRVEIGALFIRGNLRTDRSLIEGELPLQKGSLFDVKKLLRGQADLRSLGVFDSVSVEAIGLDERARTQREVSASVIARVDEGTNRYLDFRAGLEGRDILRDARQLLGTGEIQYTERNLFGFAQRLQPRLVGAVDGLQVYDSVSNPVDYEPTRTLRGVDYLVGVELPYSHPRFLKQAAGVRNLALTITPFYTTDLLGVIDGRLLREEWGLRLEVRKDLSEWVRQLYVTVGVEGKQAAFWSPADPVVEGDRLFRPRRVTGTLIPELTLDHRDRALNPTEGYFAQIQPRIVSGATLTQSREDAIGDSFMRLYVNGTLHLPLFNDWIVSQNMQYGHIKSFFGRDTIVSPDERFYLGGVGTVRGFKTDSLGPIGRRQEPTGGQFMVNYNLELRYPLLEEIGLWGGTFFDAGVLVDCYADAPEGGRTSIQTSCYEDAFGSRRGSLGKIRTSAGLGFRFLIAEQIPFVFDYGVPLDRRSGEPGGELGFNIGYTY